MADCLFDKVLQVGVAFGNGFDDLLARIAVLLPEDSAAAIF